MRATTYSGSGPVPTMSPSDQRSSACAVASSTASSASACACMSARTATITGNTARGAPSASHMRILFATGQGGGHFGPLVPFARAYARAGHEVLVAAPALGRAAWSSAPASRSAALGEPHGRSAAWAPVFSGDGPGAPFVIRELFIGLDARAALPGHARWSPTTGART